MSVGGTTDADYAGKDVAGKVVLTPRRASDVMKQAVWARGALGRRPLHDQPPRSAGPGAMAAHSGRERRQDKQGTFGFVLSQREGLRLRAELAAAGRRPTAFASKIDSEFREPASQAIVEAVIRGRRFTTRRSC